MKKATFSNRSLLHNFLPGFLLNFLIFSLSGQEIVQFELPSDSGSTIMTFCEYGDGTRDADYILDDGSIETCYRYYTGIDNSGDFMWLNAFKAGLHQYQVPGQFPAAKDTDIPQNESWVVGTSASGGFNVSDLLDPVHEIVVQRVDPYAFDGNWLLRAHGTGDIPPVCIFDLDLYKNSGAAMAVALDELGVDYHYYPFWPSGYVDNYDVTFVCLS